MNATIRGAITVRTLCIALGACAVLFLLWRFVFAGDRDLRLINERLNTMDEAIDHGSEKSGLIQSVAAATSFARNFTEDAELTAGRPLARVKGHKEIQQSVLMLRRMADTLDVAIKEREITIAPSRDRADVLLVLKGTATSGGSRQQETRQYQVTMVKQGGEWLIANAVLKDTFRRPGE